MLITLPEDISVVSKKKKIQGILGESNHISTKIQTNGSPTIEAVSWKILVTSKGEKL